MFVATRSMVPQEKSLKITPLPQRNPVRPLRDQLEVSEIRIGHFSHELGDLPSGRKSPDFLKDNLVHAS